MYANTPTLVNAFSKYNDKGTILIYEKTNLPFIPKRIFWITDVPTLAKRGGHAHRECEQFIFCVNGAVELNVNRRKWEVQLDERSLTGAYLPPKNWLDIRFVRPNSKIVVLCSHEYDESDYIRNYDDFKRFVENSV